MRQIGEFIAVLACALFTGAAASPLVSIEREFTTRDHVHLCARPRAYQRSVIANESAPRLIESSNARRTALPRTAQQKHSP